MFDELSEISLGSSGCYSGCASAGFEFDGHEYVGISLPEIFIIILFTVTGGHRNRFSTIINKLFRFLVNSNYWVSWIIWFLIQIKNVIHPFPKHLIYLRNAPHPLQPRSCFAFFKTRRTVSRLSVLKSFRLFIRSVNNRMVHRFRPFGGSVHAIAIISASCVSVYFLG